MSDLDLENELNFFLSQKKKPVFNLSALSGELSDSFEAELDLLEAADLHYVEVGEINGKNVLGLGNAELDEVQVAMQMRGLSVSAIASSIGNSSITADFSQEFSRFERALEVADWLGASYIRIFGFQLPEGDSETVYQQYRAEVARRLTEFAIASQPYGLILLLENAPGTFADTSAHCADLIDEVGSTNLRSLFDPASFVQMGENPLVDAFPPLQEQVNLLHLRDANADGSPAPLGDGVGELKGLLQTMWRSSYQGAITLKPHKGSFAGQTFEEAVARVRQMLAEIEQAES
jgi:sugar phosphate isomerase/epimerase